MQTADPVCSDPVCSDPVRSDYADLARLRQTRWQRRQHDRRGIAIALVIALLLHLVAAWLVRDWMRLRPIDDSRGVIAVRLVDAVEPAALAPPPLPEPPPRVEPVVVRPVPRAAGVAAPSTVATRTPTARIVEAAPAAPVDAAPSVRIYGVDGKIDVSHLPQAPTSDFAAPAIVPQTRKASPLPYRPSAFASQWPSDRENAFQEFVRKRTVTKSWRTKWGGGFSCSWSLFVGGCGWGYAPPNPEGMRRVRVDVPVKPVREESPEAVDAPPPWGSTIEPHG
ncbi:hypothetical protein [Tahibacter soli]|uniref:Uncharacterized protein n=1 Tax=Tahibacter soli TaxID=2983605 RepID=A0A9X3YKJ7_9GAMM|nr:hypothetical protein [Tahibacter soli]MDC8012363.1 hypothetical protein [Tahibacter soli]